MPVRDVSADLKKRRKKKKAVRFLKRFAVIVSVAAVALTVTLTRSLWYPELDGILSGLPVAEDNAELAGGSFPILMEGGASYQLEGLDNGFCVLNDSKFFSYSLEGRLNFSSQHSLSNPALDVSEKRALIYDLGGKRFSLMNRHKELYGLETENPILFAALSSGDDAAVVTKSDKFAAELMVYDVNGNNIFNYSSVSRITNVCFNSGNDGCYITSVGSRGGVLVSQIMYYRFDKIDYDPLGNPVPVWQTGYIETLVLEVRLFGENNIIVIGDTSYYCYDRNGNFISSYDYSYDLKCYYAGSSTVAFVFDDIERRNSRLVTVNSLTDEINEVSLDYTALNAEAADGYIYIQSSRGITAYDIYGNAVESSELDTDYNNFRHIGKYIFLMGYDEINRIDFS